MGELRQCRTKVPLKFQLTTAIKTNTMIKISQPGTATATETLEIFIFITIANFARCGPIQIEIQSGLLALNYRHTHTHTQIREYSTHCSEQLHTN